MTSKILKNLINRKENKLKKVGKKRKIKIKKIIVEENTKDKNSNIK